MQAKMPIGNADGQKLCNQYGIYEVGNHFFVARCVHKVADSVVCAGEGMADDQIGAGFEYLFAHLARNEAVGFAVYD